MFSCLERTTLDFTLHHFSPLSFLLDNPTSWPEPADRASLLSIEVNSLNVTILVVFMFEKHITEVTFETLLVFKFDVVLKILCSFEDPPAVPNSAEEGAENVVFPMNPHHRGMDGHEVTDSTIFVTL